MKEVAYKLGSASFVNLLNSKGDIEIELNNPDDLLEMLDYIGGKAIIKLKNTIKEYEGKKEITYSKEEIKKLTHEIIIAKDTLKKIEHIYREIISKAIAGKGLFDASHSFSSVVLFLRPIVKYWRKSETYQEINLAKICDICLAMTYHDRDNPIPSIEEFSTPLILRIMRISDELQEWDRENNSYIKDVIILNDISALLSLDIEMKDKSPDDQCDPEKFIPDKIKGILPVVEKEKIVINFTFPSKVERKSIEDKIKEKKIEGYEFRGETMGTKIELIFEKNKVKIKIS